MAMRRHADRLARFAALALQPRRLARRIERAATVDELRAAAPGSDELIAALHDGGVGIATICEVARELNDRMIRRLWALLAPSALQADSCLLVMGSEGRGEQTLKTDQDNALLLCDGVDPDAAALRELTGRFTDTLIELGFPRCPGNIMLSNRLWCQPLADFKQTIRGWWYGDEPNATMHLAIFLDARAIAGEARLLAQAREYLWQIGGDSDAYLARFASPLDQFDSAAGTWWQRLPVLHLGREQSIDLKKAGSFPLVHGVRVMALKHRLHELSTRARLSRLAAHHDLPAALARDAADALDVLLRLKLQANLRRHTPGEASDNQLRLDELATLQREQLDAALGVVRQLRQHLQVHYQLGPI